MLGQVFSEVSPETSGGNDPRLFFHICTPNSVPVPINKYGTLHLLVLELKSLWDERQSTTLKKSSCFFFFKSPKIFKDISRVTN